MTACFHVRFTMFATEHQCKLPQLRMHIQGWIACSCCTLYSGTFSTIETCWHWRGTTFYLLVCCVVCANCLFINTVQLLLTTVDLYIFILWWLSLHSFSNSYFTCTMTQTQCCLNSSFFWMPVCKKKTFRNCCNCIIIRLHVRPVA